MLLGNIPVSYANNSPVLLCPAALGYKYWTVIPGQSFMINSQIYKET